jgi:hypothetical protein
MSLLLLVVVVVVVASSKGMKGDCRFLLVKDLHLFLSLTFLLLLVIPNPSCVQKQPNLIKKGFLLFHASRLVPRHHTTTQGARMSHLKSHKAHNRGTGTC